MKSVLALTSIKWKVIARQLYDPSPFILLLVVSGLLAAAVVAFAIGFRL